MKTLYKLDGTIATNDLLQLSDINSDSNYIKFPDGTLLQWGDFTLQSNISSFNFTYSSEYVSSPFCFVSATNWWESGNIANYTIEHNIKRLTVSVYGVAFQSTKDRSGSYMLIGRWK